MSVEIVNGDCLEVMRGMEDNQFDWVITDPPYGCEKAEWDNVFPNKWYTEARRVSDKLAIITGSAGLKDSVALVGGDFIDVIAARNLNGMTRGPIGFGNWLAVVLAKNKPKAGMNYMEFIVTGDKPVHPTPKPLEFMVLLLKRLTQEAETILDPFMGSGTTLVAAQRLNRNAIGIEISEEYCAMARKRINEDQPLFTEVI